MLKKCKEDDFEQLQQVAKGRLSPDGISVFFCGAFVFSAVMLGVSFFGFSKNDALVTPFLHHLENTFLTLLVIQLLVALFFVIEKNAFRYQKLQMVCLSVIAFKLSVDIKLFN